MGNACFASALTTADKADEKRLGHQVRTKCAWHSGISIDFHWCYADDICRFVQDRADAGRICIRRLSDCGGHFRCPLEEKFSNFILDCRRMRCGNPISWNFADILVLPVDSATCAVWSVLALGGHRLFDFPKTVRCVSCDRTGGNGRCGLFLHRLFQSHAGEWRSLSICCTDPLSVSLLSPVRPVLSVYSTLRC